MAHAHEDDAPLGAAQPIKILGWCCWPSQREMVRTVVVQNPDTLDEQGRLVHSIAVGVTSELEAPTQEQPSLEMAATTGDDAR